MFIHSGYFFFCYNNHMAKIKLNSLLADLRGKYGSTVFSSNGSGFYAKQLKPPVRRSSLPQQAQRSTFSTLSKSWDTLADSDKLLWKTYSERADNERTDWFGDPYYPSARAQYMSLNTLRVNSGAAATDTPPTSDLPYPLPSMSAMIAAVPGPDDSYIDALDVFPGDVAFVHVGISIWPRPGRLSPLLPYAIYGLIPVGDFGPVTIQDFITARFTYYDNTGRYSVSLASVSADYRMAAPVYCTGLLNTEAFT